MFLLLLLAPLLLGCTRLLRARLLRRRGPSPLQVYRDLARLLRKDVVLADSASWLFRAAPYLIFAVTWVAAALVPTFATGLIFNWAVDLIAIVALLGSARFFLALAGMDVGTSQADRAVPGGVCMYRPAPVVASRASCRTLPPLERHGWRRASTSASGRCWC